jgi:hypothetical protein
MMDCAPDLAAMLLRWRDTQFLTAAYLLAERAHPAETIHAASAFKNSRRSPRTTM